MGTPLMQNCQPSQPYPPPPLAYFSSSKDFFLKERKERERIHQRPEESDHRLPPSRSIKLRYKQGTRMWKKKEGRIYKGGGLECKMCSPLSVYLWRHVSFWASSHFCCNPKIALFKTSCRCNSPESDAKTLGHQRESPSWVIYLKLPAVRIHYIQTLPCTR